MTEAQWLACTDPTQMLEYLRDKVSDRKLRLFACACCRSNAHMMTDTRNRMGVEVTERYADGLASDEELADATTAEVWAPVMCAAKADARLAAWFAARGEAYDATPAEAGDAPWSEAREGVWSSARFAAWLAQAELLHDIVGNPFRIVTINYARQTWNGGTVPKLAQVIYDERRFQDLPILADALEEAGCTGADILNHCRGPESHVRGCWAVDLILGKS